MVALTRTIRSMVDYLDLFLKELDERNRVITPKDAQRLFGQRLAARLP